MNVRLFVSWVCCVVLCLISSDEDMNPEYVSVRLTSSYGKHPHTNTELLAFLSKVCVDDGLCQSVPTF